MPIEYVCDLATDAGINEVATRVHELIGGAITSENDQILVTTAAVFSRIRAVTNERTRQWALEDWGIDLKIEVSFSLNTSAPEDEYIAGRRALSVAAMKLGEDLDVDTVLRLEADRLIMRRKDGTLTLYDWWPEWADAEVVTELPAGYLLTRDREETPEGKAP